MEFGKSQAVLEFNFMRYLEENGRVFADSVL
jgi:hypothetical protein